MMMIENNRGDFWLKCDVYICEIPRQNFLFKCILIIQYTLKKLKIRKEKQVLFRGREDEGG
jgi:hypothetical protein